MDAAATLELAAVVDAWLSDALLQVVAVTVDDIVVVTFFLDNVDFLLAATAAGDVVVADDEDGLLEETAEARLAKLPALQVRCNLGL